MAQAVALAEEQLLSRRTRVKEMLCHVEQERLDREQWVMELGEELSEGGTSDRDSDDCKNQDAQEFELDADEEDEGRPAKRGRLETQEKCRMKAHQGRQAWTRQRLSKTWPNASSPGVRKARLRRRQRRQRCLSSRRGRRLQTQARRWAGRR